MKIFVTGTDTGVGKTYVCALLLEALRREGKLAAGFKPICCGGREDVDALLAASAPGLTHDEINPVWLKSPLAPYSASLIENAPIDSGILRAAYDEIEQRFEHIVVEGVGGWEVPVTRDVLTSDFASEIGLPVVVVVDNKLGAMNHTILTVRAIRARGLRCAGLILNHVDEERDSASISNGAVLAEILEVPILLDLLHGEEEVSLVDSDWDLG